MGWSVSGLLSKNNENKIPEAVEKLQLALFSCVPFYAEILTQLKFVESKKIATAATDGLTVFLNPKFMLKLSEGQRNYIIMHEVFHVILLHCVRDDGKDARIWNIASDYVANSFVDKLAIRLHKKGIPCKRPDEGCFMDDGDDCSVEELYDYLFSGKELDEKWRTILIQFDDKQMDLIVSLSKEEREYIRQKIESLLDSASSWGCEDDHMTERILNMISARKRLPWKRLLRKMWVIDEDEESSYLTPERKYLHMGLVVSGWGLYETEKLPDIWAFIDSSGSIVDDTINEFLAQLYVISKELGAMLNIAYWDAAVTDVYKDVKNPDEVGKCIPHSSGGTDAECIYDYLHAHKIVPKILLVFTDGCFYKVPDSKVGKMKEKTIVVLEGERMGAHCNLGKEARL